ncbi:NAD(P)H-hydrate dehydratase [uncultured Ramlibacter sp.]|uniref:NAD(P)H-hydrate dehydratase n=1 Tax=uncultured Ramlibacter sp. TaxID=260755 RepID=UPI002624C656|nr:NAD(P)H-hydrate dehydratase [uncultured Ramlibacter sp.]
MEVPTHRTLDAATLATWPLPALDSDADKEERGRILVLAGSREIAGAVLLAAMAALRVGAGKLAIATPASVAPHIAVAMPEARVIALPETPSGGLHMDGIALLRQVLEGADALVAGPGLMDEAASCAFITTLLPLVAGTPVVLDALAINAVRAHAAFGQPILLTPHAGEMAHLLDISKQAVCADPQAAALAAARRWNASVALKGATTWLATPEGTLWRHQGGNAGLATSGSGDTLAGAIAGLAARGAALEQACAWGVVLHAQAGERLAVRLGPVGYLARELPLEMLAALTALQA